MKGLIGLTALAVIFGCGSAQAQYSDGTIKIGVMNDMSGTYSDLSGQGSVVAARMAVEDFGAAAKSAPTTRTNPTWARTWCARGSTSIRST